MNQPLLPITGPAPEGVAARLAVRLAAGLTGGTVYYWCAENRVFSVLTLEAGLLKHWQCEPAADQAAADALEKQYEQYGADARVRASLDIEQLAEKSPEMFLALMRRALRAVADGPADH